MNAGPLSDINQVTGDSFGMGSFIPIIEEPWVQNVLRKHKYVDTQFMHRFTSILTARFLLNLQETKRRLECGSSSLEDMSTLAFASHVADSADGFMGDLGGQLSFHNEDVLGVYDDLS